MFVLAGSPIFFLRGSSGNFGIFFIIGPILLKFSHNSVGRGENDELSLNSVLHKNYYS